MKIIQALVIHIKVKYDVFLCYLKSAKQSTLSLWLLQLGRGRGLTHDEMLAELVVDNLFHVSDIFTNSGSDGDSHSRDSINKRGQNKTVFPLSDYSKILI